MDHKLYEEALALALETSELITADAAKAGGGVFTRMLAAMRADAARALSALAVCDPDDTKTIRGLQTQIDVYRAVMTWAVTALSEGKEAWRELSDEERREIETLMNQPRQGVDDA